MVYTIKKKSIYMFFLTIIALIPFLPITPIRSNYFFDLISICEGCIFFFYHFYTKRKISIGFIWLISISSVLIISTYINGNNSIINPIFYSLRLFSFFLLISAFSIDKLSILLCSYEFFLFAVYSITLYYQLFNPDRWGFTQALNRQNFFASDNMLPYYSFEFITIIFFNLSISKKKMSTYALIELLVCYLVTIKSNAATGIVSISLCYVLLIFSSSYISKIITTKNTTIAISIMYFVIVFLNNSSHFDNFTYHFFGKKVSMARARIWSASIANIKKKFFLGYGTTKGGRMGINKVGIMYWFSHNFILEIMIQGGIILFLLFLLIFIMLMVKNSKIEHSKLLIKWLIILFCLSIAYLTEGTFLEPSQYIIFYLGYYLGEITQYYDSSEEESPPPSA